MKYFTGKRFTLNQVVILLVLAFVAIAAVGYASSVGTLSSFSPGTAISSSAVNMNFSNIASAVNDNYNRIITNSSRITTLESKQTVTVIVQSANISVGSFTTTMAACPPSYKAIGGGVDNSNVLQMHITSSSPTFSGSRTLNMLSGGAPNGWYGGASVVSTAPPGTYYFKVAVICTQ